MKLQVGLTYTRPMRNVLLIEILCDKDLLIDLIKYNGINRTITSSPIVKASVAMNRSLSLRHFLSIVMSQNPRTGLQLKAARNDCAENQHGIQIL